MIDNLNMKIAIASGKGGTGKTFVSTNLFYVLQQQNIKVSLVDCDAEEPNDLLFFKGKKEKSFEVNQKVPVIDESKCIFCGKCNEYCNYNSIFILAPSKIIKVIEDLCHGCGACSVACMTDAITEKEVSLGTVSLYSVPRQSSIIEARMRVGVFSPVSVIKAAIKAAENSEITILDAPPGTSCPFIQTIVAADYVVLVTEATPFGLSDLKQSVETLKTMNKRYAVIINRAGIGDNAVCEYLKQENIPLLMEIPFDKTIASYYSKGELITKFQSEIREQFISLFNNIAKEYGNSSN